ncbi:uncharacterized protein LOC130015266 [Mercurialis annua]|uniref:uncharacterized protein LOC130015266 n=1 Tax=Mercurialis annua TaxID=3986 RepID=UPI0024ACDCD5|nr:uncharacterized protein LOC130015266 [Mercurialis annua]
MAVAADPVVETVKSLLQDFLTKQVVAPNTHSVASIQSNCEFCGDPSHMANECYVMSQQINEQINYVGGQRPKNNPYAAAYNPGWRNHPNLSWKDNGNQTQNQTGPSFQGEQRPQQNLGNFQNQGSFYHHNNRPQHPPGFQHNEHGESLHSKIDKMMELIIMKDAKTQQALKNHAATIHNQELQIQQMAKALQNQNQGCLPSTTEANPREQVKAITLRSSKVLPKDHTEKVILEAEKEQHEENEPEKVVTKPTPLPPYVPKIPFPQRLWKPKDTWKFHQFLETFKKLQINISLADALREMPHYAKFLKDILMNKRSWDENTVPFTENCSSISLSKLPTKLDDLGSFTIPCTIGDLQTINCLCDLGASINLMPLSLFRQLLGDQRVKTTLMMLQLADHSVKKPYGIVENVLVKVEKFIFPVYFVVLDYEIDKECPLILGRPFMNTSRALIDVNAGKLTLRIGEENVEFEMKKSEQGLSNEKKCMKVDCVEERGE